MEEAKNLMDFSLMSTDQLLLSHDEIHQLIEAADCAEIRQEHDAIAAEMLRRGMPHDTGIICPEIEIITDAPNYIRSFTEPNCANCVFGQIDKWCSLYAFNYIPNFICDSWNELAFIELELPHGFLMWNGKQTAIANDEPLSINKPLIIVSGNEAYGIAELEEAVQMNVGEFGRKYWAEQHCVRKRERRQWWPHAEKFYAHRLAKWQRFEKPASFKDGCFVEPIEPDEMQKELISKSYQLPKRILLSSDVVSITPDGDFYINNNLVRGSEELKNALKATYESDVTFAESSDEIIPLYNLCLDRIPKIQVSKGNKQEEDDMPWRIEERGDQVCVIKVDDGEIEGCHDTREDAVAQLAALNAAEGESSAHLVDEDEERRRRRRKMNVRMAPIEDTGITIDVFEKAVKRLSKKGPTNNEKSKTTLVDKLKNAASALGDLLKATEEDIPISEMFDFTAKDVEMFETDSGFAVKTVNGEPWHFTWSTNAFEDRDGEVFSTKALEQYVLESEQKKHRGHFNLWHINEDNIGLNTDFAEKKWQGVVGRFLVESGPYLNNHQGKSALKFFEEFSSGHPEIAPEGWGCSPEFRYLPEQRKTGVYDWLWITRTSTLPRAAAANIWTEAKQEVNVMAMPTDSQKEAAIAIFGQEFFDRMIDIGGKKTEDLEQSGVRNKDLEAELPEEKTPVEEEKTTTVEFDMNELAEAVMKQFDVNFESISEAMTSVAVAVKEISGRVSNLEEVKIAKDANETPRYVFELKRASNDESTEVDEKDSLLEDHPQKPHVKQGAMADHYYPPR